MIGIKGWSAKEVVIIENLIDIEKKLDNNVKYSKKTDIKWTVVAQTTFNYKKFKGGFHGRAATCKPYITKHNAKHQMEWYKACHHWILKQWKRILWSEGSRFCIWQSDS